jgi:hypothetical protein
MKKFSLLLTTFFLMPGILLAQPPELKETIYVVRQQNKTAVPPDACAWALPILGGQPLYSSNISELYSVLTKNKNGSLIKIKQKVGTLLGCTAYFTPALERGYPTADLGEIWQMTLNGRDYTVTGSNRIRTDPFNPPFGFPVPDSGMTLGTSTGTVHKSFFTTPLPPVVVGSFSCTWLSDPSESGSYEDVTTCTISLYE